ncbi:kelch-like protein 32 [Lineus longissimus]|uniref:kelch-like protein 32 n=1 Tax=Lineus longissimus TaxID=88925 RepID=UPI00315C59D6
MSWRVRYFLADDTRQSTLRDSPQLRDYQGESPVKMDGYWTDQWDFDDGRISSNGHLVTLGKRLNEMFQASDYCDVTLTAESSSFRVHKIILAASSDYFNAMFSSSWNEISRDCIEMKGVSPKGLAAILDFVYTGGFKVTGADVSEILEAARHCLMSDVTTLMEKYLIKVVEVGFSNYLTMSEIGKNFDLHELLSECEPFFKEADICLENFLQFFEFAKRRTSSIYVLQRALLFTLQSLAELSTAERERLSAMLDQDDFNMLLTVTNRQGIFTSLSLVQFLLDWVEFDHEIRTEYLPDLFTKINLLTFDDEELDSLSKMPVIKDCESCKSKIMDAQEYLLKVATEEQQVDSFLVSFSGHDIEMRCLSPTYLTTMKNVLPMPDLPVKASELNEDSFVTVLDNILFVLGVGWLEKVKIGDYTGDASCCYSFDPGRNTWKQLKHLPAARTGNKLVAVGNDIYSIGGKTITNKMINLTDYYSVSNDEWTSATPLPYSYSCPLAAALNGSIYVSFARSGDKIVLNDFFRFEPAGTVWTKRALVPMGGYQELVPSGDRLYLIGTKEFPLSGQNNLKVSCYNPGTNQWTFLQQFCRGHAGMFRKVQAISDQETTYVVADFDEGEEDVDAEVDPSWTRVHILDTVSKKLALRQHYQWFPRDAMSSAILRVPLRTIQAHLTIDSKQESEIMDSTERETIYRQRPGWPD